MYEVEAPEYNFYRYIFFFNRRYTCFGVYGRYVSLIFGEHEFLFLLPGVCRKMSVVNDREGINHYLENLAVQIQGTIPPWEKSSNMSELYAKMLRTFYLTCL